MGNVRFVQNAGNRGRKTSASAPYPRLINGNGAYSGAPALVQDASFPMSNLLDPDRVSHIYVTGPNPANDGVDLIIEFDTGSAPVSIHGVGLLGFRRATGEAFPNVVYIEYLLGTTYSTSGWSGAGTTPFSFNEATDAGVLFPAPISAKFWRFRITNAAFSAAGFSLSSPFIAQTVTDLGFLYSRASETLVTPKSTVEGYGRMPVITRTGTPYRRWLLEYANNDAAARAVFDALAVSANPFVFIHPDGSFYECVMDGEEFMRDHIWAPPDRFAFVFPMRSLP